MSVTTTDDPMPGPVPPVATDLATALERAATTPARPVFIGGCPRSGTTLLAAMLGVGGDRLTIPEAVFKLRWLSQGGDDSVELPRVLAQLERDRGFQSWRVALPAPGDAPPRARLADLLQALVLDFGATAGKPAPHLWIDHTPGNIRHTIALAAAFPEAQFINLVRDVRAVAASILPLDWGPNTVWEAGPWWATHVALGLAAERRLPGRVHTVRFEDLVTRPRPVLEEVCRFLGTDFSGAMLGHREYAAMAYSPTAHHLVDAPPDPGRVDAWRQRLTPGQVEELEYRTGDLLALLGYSLEHGPAARPRPRRVRWADTARDVARRAVLDRARRRRRVRR